MRNLLRALWSDETESLIGKIVLSGYYLIGWPAFSKSDLKTEAKIYKVMEETKDE